MQNKWNYDELVKAAVGKEMLPLQRKTVEAIRQHKDLQVNAPTGSGKTIAFLIALLEAKTVYKWNYALIIAPTRELVIQIGEVFASLNTGIKHTICYGGHPFKTEVNNFKGHPEVIIGTPGRIADHIGRETFDFSKVEAFIIDEEDKIKELGFAKEIDYILEATKTLKTSIHVSATALPEHKGMHRIDFSKNEESTGNFTFFKLKVEEESHKAEALMTLLRGIEQGPTLVFFNHREAVERIADYMIHNGFNVVTYHGGLEQVERERNLIKFRNGSAKLLFVTDLAARGIDVPEVKRIIHYQYPNDEKSFIHRNGRTARMGAEGDVFIIEDKTDLLNFEYLDKLDVNTFEFDEEHHWYTEWETLYLSLGKKDKVNKIDILGFLTKDLGVKGKDIGKIDTLDFMSYIAVEPSAVDKIVKTSSDKKIKKQKFKVSRCK